MPDPPRCETCGKVPPIRKVDGSVGMDTITYQCCGEIIVIAVADLAVDTLLDTKDEAA